MQRTHPVKRKFLLQDSYFGLGGGMDGQVAEFLLDPHVKGSARNASGGHPWEVQGRWIYLEGINNARAWIR